MIDKLKNIADSLANSRVRLLHPRLGDSLNQAVLDESERLYRLEVELRTCLSELEEKKSERFKKYNRTQIAEMRPVDENDIALYNACKGIHKIPPLMEWNISISSEDLKAGSPKIGDMIARNPKNPLDQWLVAKQYFEDNFKEQ